MARDDTATATNKILECMLASKNKVQEIRRDAHRFGRRVSLFCDGYVEIARFSPAFSGTCFGLSVSGSRRVTGVRYRQALASPHFEALSRCELGPAARPGLSPEFAGRLGGHVFREAL
jgi:hypothetical protein